MYSIPYYTLEVSRFKIKCLLEKGSAHYFSEEQTETPSNIDQFILHVPTRKDVHPKIFVRRSPTPSSQQNLACVSRRFRNIICVIIRRNLWVFTGIPFLSTNHMIYWDTSIRPSIFIWTTWDTRGHAFAVWITHWISLLLLTERNSTDRQLRQKKMAHLEDYISWSRKDRREFKLNNPEKVAQRWGILKRNKGMTFKKLCRRTSRYYYPPGNIKKVSQYICLYLHGWYVKHPSVIFSIFKLNSSSLYTVNLRFTTSS